jgi:hypothetical protein
LGDGQEVFAIEGDVRLVHGLDDGSAVGGDAATVADWSLQAVVRPYCQVLRPIERDGRPRTLHRPICRSRLHDECVERRRVQFGVFLGIRIVRVLRIVQSHPHRQNHPHR